MLSIINKMSIITLTTDFGRKDYFVAGIKGKILSELPNAVIVDISHEISHYDIAETAYVLQKSYKDFPKETIHIVGVNALLHSKQKPMCFLFDGHYFIGADNGFISLLCDEKKPEEIIEITINSEFADGLSPVKDIFVPVACHLARGGLINLLGNHRTEYIKYNSLKPSYREDRILQGNIIYIDHFGNAVSNITREIFEKHLDQRNFRIFLRQKDYSAIEVNHFYDHYYDIVQDFNKENIAQGRTMCVFNSADSLEVTMYKSNPSQANSASELMGLKKGDNIIIEFLESTKENV